MATAVNSNLAFSLLLATVASGLLWLPTASAHESVNRYRMIVDLVHKPTSRRIHIDYPFVCRNRSGGSLGGGTVSESRIEPILYGEKLPDGTGVAVLTPKICQKDFDNIPAAVLPMIFHIPDLADSRSMVAHLSKRSFTEGESQFALVDARIELAADPSSEPEPTNGIIPKDFFEKDDMVAYYCRTMRPVAIPQELRAMADAQWPADRPEWWVADRTGDTYFSAMAYDTPFEDRTLSPYHVLDLNGDDPRFAEEESIPFSVSGNDQVQTIVFGGKFGMQSDLAYCGPDYRHFISKGNAAAHATIRLGEDYARRVDFDLGWTWGSGLVTHKNDAVYQNTSFQLDLR